MDIWGVEGVEAEAELLAAMVPPAPTPGAPSPPGTPPRTRRVRLVREEGRGVSSQYGREGGVGGLSPPRVLVPALRRAFPSPALSLVDAGDLLRAPPPPYLFPYRSLYCMHHIALWMQATFFQRLGLSPEDVGIKVRRRARAWQAL